MKKFLQLFSLFRAWKKDRRSTIAFFHLQCDNFGGGEKVLWNIIYDLLKSDLNKKVVIYAERKIDKKELFKNINDVFNIPLNSSEFIDRITIVNLTLGFLSTISVFKLWSVNIGAMIASLEALFFRWPLPRVFIETAGFSLALIPARLLPTTKYTATYLHYPQITKDNIDDLRKQGKILKYLYLKAFSILYYISLKSTHKIVVNSNWTRCKLDELWKDKKLNISVCYPPINAKSMIIRKNKFRKEVIVSLAQFRPEKNHAFQIRIFSELLRKVEKLLENNENLDERLKLQRIYKELKFKICGTSQSSNPEYTFYLNSLKELIKNQGLEDKVELLIDSNSQEIQELLFTSKIGIHTMENEHFGICVAEFLSAGLLVIAHKSGGPEMDILRRYKNKQIGFLASTVREYVDTLLKLVLEYETPSTKQILINAHQAALERFQDNESFGETCTKILNI